MENKSEKEFIRSTRRADVYAESSTEYSLPDYNGDVRKLLFTEAEVRPAGKFSDGGELEFSGIVVYNVVYLDGEGKLSSVSFSSDYEYSVKSGSETYVDARADTKVANYGIRLTGPRRISAKASVVGSVTVSERDTVSVSGSAFEDGGEVEMLEREVMIRSVSTAHSVEREYAEKLLSLDGAISEEVKIIYSGAEVDIDDVKVEDGALRLEGELKLYAVVQNGDEPAYLTEREIDISESIPYEGAADGEIYIPEAVVVSVKDSVNPTDMGSDVVLSVIVEYGLRGEKNAPVSLICDAYMQKCVTENTYEDFSYTAFSDYVTDVSELHGKINREELEATGLREVIILRATPKLEGVSCDGNTVTVEGEARFSGVISASNDDGTISYHGVKFATPFTKNVKLNCQYNDKMRLEPKVRLSHTTGSIDADNVYASCTLELGVLATQEMSVRALSESQAREDLPFEERPARVTVYYPDRGETLFSVAKRFHTTTAKVAADNSLSVSTAADGTDTSLSGIKRLVIS